MPRREKGRAKVHSLTVIRCNTCSWLRHARNEADAVDFAFYRSRIGPCAGHEIETSEPRAMSLPGETLATVLGPVLWPLEIAAARLFWQAFNLGRRGGPLVTLCGKSVIMAGMRRVARHGFKLGQEARHARA